MKFEMNLGFIENEKITVETWDFEKIEIIKDFIEFQEEHGCSRPHVLLSPRARVQMTLANKGTITSAFEHTIRHVSGLEPLWNYMKNKQQHNWGPNEQLISVVY